MKMKVLISMLVLVACIIGCSVTPESKDKSLSVERTEIVMKEEKEKIEAINKEDESVPSKGAVGELMVASMSETASSIAETTQSIEEIAPSIAEAASGIAETTQSIEETDQGIEETVPSITTSVPDTFESATSLPEDPPVQEIVPTQGGTFDHVENLEIGQEIENTGIIWGGAVGGGDFQPATDGYGDGTTITFEPIN